jgi:hypothetical protein
MPARAFGREVRTDFLLAVLRFGEALFLATFRFAFRFLDFLAVFFLAVFFFAFFAFLAITITPFWFSMLTRTTRMNIVPCYNPKILNFLLTPKTISGFPRGLEVIAHSIHTASGMNLILCKCALTLCFHASRTRCDKKISIDKMHFKSPQKIFSLGEFRSECDIKTTTNHVGRCDFAKATYTETHL